VPFQFWFGYGRQKGSFTFPFHLAHWHSLPQLNLQDHSVLIFFVKDVMVVPGPSRLDSKRKKSFLTPLITKYQDVPRFGTMPMAWKATEES
jgi:hypothetical protein